MVKNQNLSGIGGWLALLILGLSILGPLIGFGRLSSEFRTAVEQYPQLTNHGPWQSYTQMCWLIFAATIGVSISAGYRLWKVHLPESVKFAIIALWVSGPVGNVLYLVAAVMVLGGNVGGQAFAKMIGGTISPVISAAIWTAYLKRSIRVRNTYKLPFKRA